MKSYRVTLAVLSLTALPAVAQQFQGMEYDQPLNAALQEMLFNFSNVCQSTGDPGACNGYNYVQQVADYMVGASNACLMGNEMACNDYRGALGEIQNVYTQYSQAFYGGTDVATGGDTTGGAAINPLGETHDQRMGAIAQFGADNTAAFNQRMQQMDQNQATWMSANQ